MRKMPDCPKCGKELKVDHYEIPDRTKQRLFASRLICTTPCDYKKEFPRRNLGA